MEHWFLDQELMGQSQMQFLFCITSCSWIQTRAHIKRMINKDTAQQHAEPQPGPGPAQRATQGFSTVLLLHGDSRQGQVSRPSQPDSRTDRKAETPYELSSERWRFTRQYLTAFKGPPTNVAMSLHNYSGVRDTRMIWWRTSVLQQLHSKTLKLKGGWRGRHACCLIDSNLQSTAYIAFFTADVWACLCGRSQCSWH